MSAPLGRLLLAVEPDAASFEKTLGATLGGSRVAGIVGKAGAGLALGFGAAFAGALAIGGTLEHIGSKFHSAFATIRVETGATGHQLDGLETSFKNVLEKTPAGFGDVASAIATVNQKLGLTDKPLENVALSIIRLSRITKTDLQGNLASVTSLFNNWNVSSHDQVGTLDQLFRASQKSGVAVGELASQAVQGGVQLRNVGFTLKDSVSLLALLGKQGLGVSTIIPGIAKAMALAAKEGKPANQVFRDTFTAIRNAPNDTKAAGIALDVFGARAGPKLGALIRSGKLSWDDFSKSISKGDTIKKAAADVGTWQSKLAILRNELEVKLQPIATKVFDALGKGVVWVGTQIEVAFGPNGSGTRAVTWFKGIVADLSVWWDAHGAQVIATAQRIAAGVSNGINAIRTGISAVVAAFEENRGRFDEIAGRITGLWAQIYPTIRAVGDLIIAVTRTVLGIVEELWARFGGHVLSHVMVAFRAVVQFVQSQLQGLRGIIEILTGIITLKWGKVWQGIKDVADGIWNEVLSIAHLGLDILSGIIGLGMAAVSLVWDHAWSGFTSVVDGIWGGIERSVGSGVNHVIDLLNGIIRAYDRVAGILHLPHIDQLGHVSWAQSGPAGPKPGDVGFIGPVKVSDQRSAPQVPHRASGGFAEANRPYWFGEKGTELGVPSNRLRIYPADVSRDLLIGGAHQPATIDARTIVEGHVYGDAHLRRILDDHDRNLAATLKAGQHP